ncbi:glycoside hydrolase family 16 protein [Geofilum rhodophaeum]|uniref:glycoside hydrolase family 16 protein n=1 Tax=Geofilum rhodophaeum TaxID=1965019 RepID=UPI000B51F361|nr:glycoside hydrolase family 16 protein [Geofilum rhodophaeum]
MRIDRWGVLASRAWLLVLMGLFLLTGCSSRQEWALVWSDEFEYEGLPDSSRWSYDTLGNAYGWGNRELQCYTAQRDSNAWVSGGFLNITAHKERYKGFDYTSARLITKGKGDWLYGRVEVRAKVPGGRGIWPAIWMLPSDNAYGGWPHSGEIDIMEHVGFEPDSIFTTVHTGAFNHSIGTDVGAGVWMPTSETEFFVYGIEWYPDRIDFFIDETKVFTFENSGQGAAEWPFDQRFHLLMNVAVGGNWGGAHGIAEDICPATMVVDYVRVYNRGNL